MRGWTFSDSNPLEMVLFESLPLAILKPEVRQMTLIRHLTEGKFICIVLHGLQSSIHDPESVSVCLIMTWLLKKALLCRENKLAKVLEAKPYY